MRTQSDASAQRQIVILSLDSLSIIVSMPMMNIREVRMFMRYRLMLVQVGMGVAIANF